MDYQPTTCAGSKYSIETCGGQRIMLKAYVSGGDYSPASNELDLKIRIIKPESKEENEYGDFIKTYAFPTKSSEIPLLEVSIIKKGTEQ